MNKYIVYADENNVAKAIKATNFLKHRPYVMEGFAEVDGSTFHIVRSDRTGGFTVREEE